MAFKIWNGANADAGSFSPNGVPANNDEVSCPQGQSATKTDTGGALKDKDFNLFKTHRLFTGDVGASGAPLQFAADLLVHEGSGGCFIECNDVAASLTMDEVRLRGANAGVAMELGTNATNLGDYKLITVDRGILTIKASLVFAANPIVTVGSMGNVGGDATLIIADMAAVVLADLIQTGGKATTHNIITNLAIHAGLHIKDINKAVNVDVFGGTLQYDHIAAAGDVVLITVHAGGTLDFMQSVVTTAGGVRRTIDKVIAKPGSNVFFDEATIITTFDDQRTGAR